MAFTLRVGAVVTDVVKSPLIKMQTEPLQIIFNPAGIFIFGTLRIEILNAKYAPLVSEAGIEPGYKRGKYIAEMHPPRRGRREATGTGMIIHYSVRSRVDVKNGVSHLRHTILSDNLCVVV